MWHRPLLLLCAIVGFLAVPSTALAVADISTDTPLYKVNCEAVADGILCEACKLLPPAGAAAIEWAVDCVNHE